MAKRIRGLPALSGALAMSPKIQLDFTVFLRAEAVSALYTATRPPASLQCVSVTTHLGDTNHAVRPSVGCEATRCLRGAGVRLKF